MKNASKLLAALLLSGLSSGISCFASEEERHIIAASELSGLFTLRQPGLGSTVVFDGAYYQLLRNVLEAAGLAKQYRIEVMPAKRAKLEFIKGNAACYAPGLQTFSPDELALAPDTVVSSLSFNRAKVRVISATARRLVSGINDIRRSDVISLVYGVPVNAEMQHMLDRARDSVMVNSEVDSLKLLRSGRVDLILAFYPDVIFAYQELGISDEYPFDKSYSPLQINDNVVCHLQHKDAIDAINIKLAQYQQNGTLQRILGPLYIAPAESN
ncbi:hypothetical protein [Arsukibacterium indicum]|uniref:Solute-binding protein family 3/N-terminal domain-containing protein n=1 Tax=Arsukibacterium indicum TaxID=2848612 RepID=A0ABS6MKF3_9GAMM|nr:hypothetical protein [Arsukibacterium indicum]MBV2129303.1 hypothetical protein [Arsukibacterium indicum]